MQFGELIPLTGALLNFSLALFVFCQSPRSTIARVYFLLGVSFAVWNYGTFWMFRVTEYHEALFWARFLQFGVIFIPITLCHVSCLVANFRVAPWLLWTAYSLHGLLFLSNFTPFFISGVHHVTYAWYSVAGTGFWIFSGVFSLGWVSVFVLLRHRRNLPPAARRRITPLLFAHASFAFFGCNDVLPILSVYHYPFTDVQVYPFGSMAVIFYGTVVAYSVLHHQLLEVRIILSRNIAKAVRLLFLFLSGLCTLLVFWLVHPDGFTPFSFFAGLAALMTGALCAALFFPRLFGQGSEVVERRILGDCFEYQDQVLKFIDGMAWYGDMDALLDDLDDLFTRVLGLESYQLILRDETLRLFGLSRAYPASLGDHFGEIKSHSPIFLHFESSKDEYLARNQTDLHTRHASMEGQARRQLAALEAHFCFPLTSNGEPLGLLLTGNRPQQPITATDINLLIALAKNLSIMINQIRLKTQILQAEELDLLGRMSRGMAHDLNNLLTPVCTLLQLATESHPHTVDDELLPVALRNLKTMRSYIREALFFSENLRPDIQSSRLDALIAQAIEVARNSRRKEVRIETRTSGEARAEVDEVLMQRLVANLISNAIDASPAGGCVHVELLPLIKDDGNRDWLRLRISDQGEGISKDDLDRVFKPYFTTKNRGDEARGFGLGLAICRKIVHLHKGSLSIASQLGKGTTVHVDLPRTHLRARPALISLPL